MPTLIIVVPCYNEEAILPSTLQRLLQLIQRLEAAATAPCSASLCFVDDGSRDATWQLIAGAAARNPGHIHGIKLAHNVGHQQALWAGLEWAAEHADAAVSIDADLQDDETAILSMAEHWQQGADIVYGVRRRRQTDTWFKRTTAQGFYRMLRALGSDVLYNHADFRLMSRRALRLLMEYPERNLFLRGMIYHIGLPHAVVCYDRRRRQAGESKYPLGKMLSFALDGITSFSIRPLRYITLLGLLFIAASLVAIVYGLTAYAGGKALPGWTSLIVSLWFIGGAILTAMGIIGEYVGKIYIEVKRRPRYAVEATV